MSVQNHPELEESLLLNDEAFEDNNDPTEFIFEDPSAMLFGQIVYDL